jgi:DNA-directed RNA polymerase
LREVVPPLEARILMAQREALRLTTSKASRAPWAHPVQLLDADVLALITVCAALRGVLVESDGIDTPITTLAYSVAASVQDEVNFREWIKDHREKRKEDGDLRDLEAAFKRAYPNPDRRAWRQWRRKMQLAVSQSWDNHVRLHTGAALIQWLVEVAPDRFEKFERWDDGKRKLCLRLSAETVEQMNDIEQRKALVRPRMMPMLIPPRDWEYDDDDVKPVYAQNR